VTQVKSPHDYFQRLCRLVGPLARHPLKKRSSWLSTYSCVLSARNYDEFRQIASQLYARTPRSDTALVDVPARSRSDFRTAKSKREIALGRQADNQPTVDRGPARVCCVEAKESMDFSALWCLLGDLGSCSGTMLAVSLDLTQSWLSKDIPKRKPRLRPS